MSATNKLELLRHTTWPEGELEHVAACPLCGSVDRQLLHDQMIDDTFLAATGVWTLHRCAGCGVAYLDPRPTPQSIGKAYATYYTHVPDPRRKSYAELSFWRKLKRRVENGYVNRRYGGNLVPALRWNGWLAPWFSSMRLAVDREHRHLPPLPSSGATLLDVGCGSGSFLVAAQSLGWSVVGLEPDPAAVAEGRRQGLDIRQGGIEHFGSAAALFDVITLNHVIEHVHDPLAVLRTCHRLLRPGGTLWLETPNIDALGHAWFGKSWRGLEAPRHLMLFSDNSLRHALGQAGFGAVRHLPRLSAAKFTFKCSERIRRGLDPHARSPTSFLLRLKIKAAILIARGARHRAEFLTVVAFR